jgi:hypothetical protein
MDEAHEVCPDGYKILNSDQQNTIIANPGAGFSPNAPQYVPTASRELGFTCQ